MQADVLLQRHLDHAPCLDVALAWSLEVAPHRAHLGAALRAMRVAQRRVPPEGLAALETGVVQVVRYVGVAQWNMIFGLRLRLAAHRLILLIASRSAAKRCLKSGISRNAHGR